MADIVRKVIIGPNPKDAMAYYIGMKAGKGHVSEIVQQENALSLSGLPTILVYVQGENMTYLWKRVEGMPVLIEYDCNFE